MKILIDAHCFDYKTSEGINSYLKGIYTNLIPIAPNLEFYIVASEVEKVRSIFGEYENVTYVPLTSTNKIYRLLFEFPAIIKRYKIDVAHYQYTSPLIKNCKNIITLHDILFVDYPEMFPWSYRVIKGLLFKLSAKRADLLLTVSEYSKQQISKHFNIASDKIYVTPNAVSDDFYNINLDVAQRFVKSQGVDKYILYVSRIEPRKNQIALLKTYYEQRLWKSGYDLVFIGRKTLPTPDFDRYIEAIPSEVIKHIHIYNQVDYTDLKYWYRAASLFVYPALAEGFGVPPIEAGAAGVPCLCCNKTAMGDFQFFEDNLIDIDDTLLLSNSIRDILLGEKQVNTSAISEQIHTRYNWVDIANDLYKLLQHLI